MHTAGGGAFYKFRSTNLMVLSTDYLTLCQMNLVLFARYQSLKLHGPVSEQPKKFLLAGFGDDTFS